MEVGMVLAILAVVAVVAIIATWVFTRSRPRPAPAAPEPAPDPIVTEAVRMAKERRDKTAVAEFQELAGMDGDLVSLQTELAKKRTQARRLRGAGSPNPLLEQEVADIELKVSELDTDVFSHEAYLRATYPEYWKR